MMPLNNLKVGACTICGGKEFSFQPVLWPSLIQEWELGEDEADYINRQQGHTCLGCGSSMRVRVLALAILSVFVEGGTFAEFIHSSAGQQLKILEINKAGNLHEFLKGHPGHKLVEYPEYDMMALNLSDHHFDLVIHSDTLEHISDPLKALRECCRVLKEGGRLFYTIPVIVDRQTRSRKGMSPSYHGSPDCNAADYLVHTEFGSDAWKLAFEAGFKKLRIHAQEYPAGMAYEAEK
jgi:SAM-dependent methyltransferase